MPRDFSRCNAEAAKSTRQNHALRCTRTPGGKMKIRSLLALVGLAVSFALPTFGQQKDATDPRIIQQLEEIGRKHDEAFDRNDEAAEAALFTDDAIFVTPRGLVYGRQA